MEKINVAELLHNCPKGMELDCYLFNGLKFDHIDTDNENYPIVCRAKDSTGEYYTHTFTKYGWYTSSYDYSKCVIFPKGKTTWEGFVPPCKFKDGDIISDSLGTCIYKGEGKIKGTVDYYCGIHSDYFVIKSLTGKSDSHYGNIVDYRLATEEEKEKLFQAIKDNGYKWNSETNTLEKRVEHRFKVGDRIRHKRPEFRGERIVNICCDTGYFTTTNDWINIAHQDDWELVPNKFDINTLKPFDKVLVRDTNEQMWVADLFSHVVNRPLERCSFACVGHYPNQCIPYEGNEHLLGTTDDCDKYFKH